MYIKISRQIFKLTLALLLISYVTNKKLVMIQQTFRHGARYPYFPECLNNFTTPQILSSIQQLSTQGKNMHYVLGKLIYNKYWSQLFAGSQYQNKYDQSQIYVKSTDVNRTIQSAQSHLFGLLQKLPKLELSASSYQFSQPAWKYLQKQEPNTTFQVYPQGSGYHPTPVHVEKRGGNACNDGDFLTKYDDSNCPNQKFWKSQNLNSDEIMSIKRDQRIKDAINALSEEVGKSIIFEEVYKWKDTATCMKYLGYPYLKIFQNPQHKRILEFIQVYSMYLAYFSQKDQIQAVATNYLKKTLEILQAKANQQPIPTILIYSAHDLTIAMILAALNLVNVKCIIDHYMNNIANDETCIWQYPSFAASIIFELWNNQGEYTIKMLYLGQPVKLPICDMKFECTLKQFKEWVNDFTIKDVSKACGYAGNQKVYYAVIFLLSSSIVLFIGYVVFLHAKIKKIDSIGRAKKQGYVVNFEQKVEDKNNQYELK